MLSLSCIEYRIAGTGKGVDLKFGDDAVQRIAEIAWQVNESTENIGARRLHNVMERLLDIISFEAPDRDGESITIDAAYVNEHLEALSKDEDLSRFIL
jgi:ATP-dependent HslUV protease ATP-binding subunit HslU